MASFAFVAVDWSILATAPAYSNKRKRCHLCLTKKLTRRCLLTCDKAGAGDWQPVGLSVATVTTVRPC